MKTPTLPSSQTRLVASMQASAPSRSVDAEIREEAGRYYLVIDGAVVHRETGSISAPIEAMVREIDRRLGRSTMFGLRAACETRNFAIAYGSAKQQAATGRPGTPIPCVEEAMETYDDSSLTAALKHASVMLKKCCR